MNNAWLTRLRAALMIWAGIVGVLAAWIVVAELLRPRLDYFPASWRQAEQLSAARRAASLAANIGVIRGSLWTAAAMTEATPLLFAPARQQSAVTFQADVALALRASERAARLAPHDSRNWLMLAGLEFRRRALRRNAKEALKLSYYTGPNEFALMPLRLLVAAGMIWDPALQALVQLEIDRILVQRPDLKPAIVAAYNAAVPQTRKAIEIIVRNTDPGFLSTLTADVQH